MESTLLIIQQIAFAIIFTTANYIMIKRFLKIRRNILLGKPKNRNGHFAKRLKTMMLMALGQKQMFDRPLAGIMHFSIYAGFILINVEILEIVLDGFLGTHRLFVPLFGSIYTALISFFEILALGVVISCIIFFSRRNLLKLPRFTKPEMKGWPKLDANLILIWEIVLMVALLNMNGTDLVLQTRAAESEFIASHYPQTGNFAVSATFVWLFESLDTRTLIILERIAWWVHIVGIFIFAIYITYSKHLHIFLAFPNTFYSNLRPHGEMENMPSVTNEVNIMLGVSNENPESDQGENDEVPTFGAKDIKDLTWKNLLDAYSCTECGRCTSVCPANLTGKKLSPRKIMMDVRDRAEEVGIGIDKNGKEFEDGKSLYGDYTTKEELMACTTCNACVEVCPININPLDIILQQRRYIAMEESGTPASWNAMFSNIENNFAPWAFPATERFKWAEEIKSQNSNQ